MNKRVSFKSNEEEKTAIQSNMFSIDPNEEEKTAIQIKKTWFLFKFNIIYQEIELEDHEITPQILHFQDHHGFANHAFTPF